MVEEPVPRVHSSHKKRELALYLLTTDYHKANWKSLADDEIKPNIVDLFISNEDLHKGWVEKDSCGGGDEIAPFVEL
jgi:hypothetical protein